MTTNTSKSTNIGMSAGAPVASTTEQRSFDMIMSDIPDEDWYSSSTPHARSPVPEDQDSPATVDFIGRVQQPAANTNNNNETNDNHPHNFNHRNTSDESSAQRPGHAVAQENCRSATKPRAPSRPPTTSSPNGSSSRRIPEVFTAPRSLGAVTGGVSGPSTMQIVQATIQNPVAQTMDRGVLSNDKRRTAAPRVSETTAEPNIQDGEISQHMSPADSRVHDSIAVVSDEPSFVVATHDRNCPLGRKARLKANHHIKTDILQLLAKLSTRC